MNARLEVVGTREDREVVPVGDAGSSELALGKTTSRLFLRGPSGKVYVADVPEELVVELCLESGPG